MDQIRKEVDIMERIEALAKLLGVEVEDLAVSKYDERTFENKEAGEYIVLTEEEAYEEAEEIIKDTIEECGIESFSECFQEWILDSCVDKEWFDGYLEEYYLDYINDIRDEEASYEKYKSRLDEEMDDAGVDTEEEFLYYLIEDAGNSIDWYIDNFGYEDFKTVCEENDLIDWDSVIEEVISEDGLAHSIATYDGKEQVVGEYFIYRLN